MDGAGRVVQCMLFPYEIKAAWASGDKAKASSAITQWKPEVNIKDNSDRMKLPEKTETKA